MPAVANKGVCRPVPDVFIPPPMFDDWLRFSGRSSSWPPQPAQRLTANAQMAASGIIHRFRIFSSSFRFHHKLRRRATTVAARSPETTAPSIVAKYGWRV
jgi:hypothetical protein